jgi:hypothetical protein
MTPTPQEKQWLRDYLYQTMQYRETFEEVYDHILLALDHLPRPQFFESAVAKIIADDFGSDNGLYDLEQNCKRAANRDIAKQYLSCMRIWTSTNLILLTGLISCFLGLLIFKFPIGFAILSFICFLMLPVLLFLIRKIVIYFQRDYRKASLKDEITVHITFRITVFIWGVGGLISWINRLRNWIFKIPDTPANVVHHSKHIEPRFSVGVLIAIGLVTWMILHFIAVVKIYRREFKAGMMAK